MNVALLIEDFGDDLSVEEQMCLPGVPLKNYIVGEKMDHNLKKEEKQFITLIIGFIVVIIFGLMAMFISQFGGLETLTPLHFALGFIKAGIVFFICFFVFRLYGNGRRQRQIQKWEARGWKTTAYVGNVSTTYRYGVSESGPRKEINRIIMCDMCTKWMIKITIMISLKRLRDGNRRLPYGTIRTIRSGM